MKIFCIQTFWKRFEETFWNVLSGSNVIFGKSKQPLNFHSFIHSFIHYSYWRVYFTVDVLLCLFTELETCDSELAGCDFSQELGDVIQQHSGSLSDINSNYIFKISLYIVLCSLHNLYILYCAHYISRHFAIYLPNNFPVRYISYWEVVC